MAKNGGKRIGAGRKKGSKATHTLQAIKTREAFIRAVEENLQPILTALLDRASKGDVAAIKEMLDRAWGKPSQMLQGDPTKPLTIIIPRPVADAFSLHGADHETSGSDKK